MISLRLHGNIYSEASVKAAVAAFTEHATVALSRDAAYWVVTVENEDPDHARLVARELGNMALGLSIDAGAGAR
jgi:hypothetical protein